MDTKISFIVELVDILDNIIYPVNIQGDEALANFLLHYDKTKYIINDIAVLGLIEYDITKYIQKDNQLETGGKDVNE